MRRTCKSSFCLLTAVLCFGGLLTLAGCNSSGEPTADDKAKLNESKQARQAEDSGKPAAGATDAGQSSTTGDK